ncbi:MAG: PAS domain S-box protein [Candidatus Margulisbacteria bacterium]|nr:PAS domain S-box protein [Candidatus Margulisiibacteriota bacterium]MBU1021293.1 PAS domain S-box protein [Candidatus Margulisiibacteriota bacterium]MBU1729218.1 PAS domain S-box protein [Candidatus Margulisiibacteriota bacterium]
MIEIPENEYKKMHSRLIELEAIVESAQDAIYMTDLNGKLIEFNDYAESMTGYKRSELVGLSYQDMTKIIPVEQLPKIAMIFAKFTTTGSFGPEEIELIRKDHKRILIEVNGKVVELEGQKVLVGIARDVTERKQVEGALLKKEEKYRNLIDKAGDPIVIFSRLGKIILINEQLTKESGYPKEELEGMNVLFAPILDVKNKAIALKNFFARMRGQHIPPYELEMIRKDGSRVSVEVKAVPIIEDGKIVGDMAILRDLTERKQAEKEVRDNQERLSLAQAVANIGTWDWDIVNNTLIWSDTIEPMFGFNPGEFKKTYEAFLACVHPDDRKQVVDAVNNAIEKDKKYAIEHRIVWPDGKSHWVSETGKIFRDKQGKAVRMLGVVQDITERKLVDEKIKALSVFPEENPNIVMKVDKDGNVLYMNPFTVEFISKNDLFKADEILPSNIQEIIDAVLSERKAKKGVEHRCAKRIFSFDFSPYVEDNSVYIYGRDITAIKESR